MWELRVAVLSQGQSLKICLQTQTLPAPCGLSNKEQHDCCWAEADSFCVLSLTGPKSWLSAFRLVPDDERGTPADWFKVQALVLPSELMTDGHQSICTLSCIITAKTASNMMNKPTLNMLQVPGQLTTLSATGPTPKVPDSLGSVTPESKLFWP